MEKLVIVGATTWAAETTLFAEENQLFEVMAYTVDKNYLVPDFLGRPVYPMEDLEQYVDKDSVKLFISISWHQKLSDVRRIKYEELKRRGFQFANLISPKAIVNCSTIGEGNLIATGANVGYNTVIGNGNFILAQTLIAHGTTVGNDNAFAARACIGGDCKIGNQNYIGLNATIFNEVQIGFKNIIGGGAVLKQSISDFTIVSAIESKVKKTNEKVVELAVAAENIKGVK